MKHLLLLLLVLLLAGCHSKRVAAPKVVPVETSTTRHVIHHVSLDTTPIMLPRQSAHTTTIDSFSHLETDAAISEAAVNPDGTLSHWLENKRTPIPVVVPATHDTLIIETYKEIPVEMPTPIEVERKLTWWERTCTRIAPWSLGLNLLAGVFYFRHSIIKLLRRLFFL